MTEWDLAYMRRRVQPTDADLSAENARLREALREVLEFQSAPTQPTIHNWGRWRRVYQGASHE